MTLTNEQVPVALPPPAFTGHVSAVLAVRCRDTLAATNGSLDKRTPFPQTFRPDTPARAATFILPTMSRRPSPGRRVNGKAVLDLRDAPTSSASGLRATASWP